MTQLMSNDPWRWGVAQQEAFDQLKKQLAEDVVLAIPTEEGKFHMEADASEGAIGTIFSQEQDGKWCPVTFYRKPSQSRNETTKVTTKNYSLSWLPLTSGGTT